MSRNTTILPVALLMYVGGVVLLRNFPFAGGVRLTV
jgi:hypothetical protein